MYRKILLFTTSFLIPLFLCSQSVFSGKVIDSHSRQPLAFVNILVSGTTQGVSSDIDGKFSISFDGPSVRLEFSYVGYQTLVMNAKPGKDQLILMSVKQLQLAEIQIFAGANPADRIMGKASQNRNENNPEKKSSFTYTSYNKFYVTADFKQENDTLNTLDTAGKNLPKTKAEKLLDSQHLFLTESVSKRKFMHPDRNHEDVIGSRTSGLKTPFFTALGNQMQSFSFYDNTIKLFDRAYMSPLVPGNTNKYLFILEDTLYNGKDSIFVMSFRPKKGKNFDGLKGVIYINTNGYAVQNVIAEPVVNEGLFSIKIQQKYDCLDGKYWFPSQLNTDIYYNSIYVGDSILTNTKKGKDAKSAPRLKMVSRSYIRDVVLNPPLRKNEFGSLEVEIANDATEKDENFWNQYRVDSLSKRDRKTYTVLDSIGKKENLDFKIQALSALVDGQLPWGYIAFDLNRILDVNDYEKFRAGLGIHTSDRLSRHFTIGGYGAYGFHDQQFKYGGDFSIFPFKKNKEYALTYSYSNDIVETGGISFYKEFSNLIGESFRTNLLSVFDKQEIQKVSLSFRAFNYFLWNLFVSDERRDALSSFRFGIPFDNGSGSATWNTFYFTEAGIQLKYIYREKFSEFLNHRISDGSDYPVIYANAVKGFNNLSGFNGQFDYEKYEFKIYKRFITAKIGKPSFQLMGGWVQGNIPYTKLFMGRGTFVNYSISVPNTFETMGINEFLSDRYIAFYYNHDFGRLLLRIKHLQPDIVFSNKAGFGSLSHPGNQFDFPFKTMEKGYYETGLLLNNLIRQQYYGIGAGIFYRYGPYAFTDETKNIAVKFSFSLNL